jgi:hypothetical protein
MNESVKKLQDKDREQKSMCADAMRSLIHSVDLRMAYEALALAFRFHIAVDSNSQQPLTLPSMVSMVISAYPGNYKLCAQIFPQEGFS